MKELRNFINGLREMEYEAVGIGEVFGEEESKVIDLDNLLSSVEEIGVKEVTDIYNESFEFFSNDGAYMSINAVY